MALSSSDKGNVEFHDLALQTGTKLWLSLFHNVSKPQDLFPTLRSHSHLAMMDAARVVSPSQLIVAANMALTRKSNNPAWETVMGASSSTHVEHVLRDYAFGEDSIPHDEAAVLVLAVGGTLNDFQAHLKEVGLNDPQPIPHFFAKQKTPEEIANIYRWYKITTDEVAMSSLEQAVLTRISTKFYL
jgi:hypothetical protein